MNRLHATRPWPWLAIGLAMVFAVGITCGRNPPELRTELAEGWDTQKRFPDLRLSPPKLDSVLANTPEEATRLQAIYAWKRTNGVAVYTPLVHEAMIQCPAGDKGGLRDWSVEWVGRKGWTPAPHAATNLVPESGGWLWVRQVPAAGNRFWQHDESSDKDDPLWQHNESFEPKGRIRTRVTFATDRGLYATDEFGTRAGKEILRPEVATVYRMPRGGPHAPDLAILRVVVPQGEQSDDPGLWNRWHGIATKARGVKAGGGMHVVVHVPGYPPCPAYIWWAVDQHKNLTGNLRFLNPERNATVDSKKLPGDGTLRVRSSVVKPKGFERQELAAPALTKFETAMGEEGKIPVVQTNHNIDLPELYWKAVEAGEDHGLDPRAAIAEFEKTGVITASLNKGEKAHWRIVTPTQQLGTKHLRVESQWNDTRQVYETIPNDITFQVEAIAHTRVLRFPKGVAVPKSVSVSFPQAGGKPVVAEPASVITEWLKEQANVLQVVVLTGMTPGAGAKMTITARGMDPYESEIDPAQHTQVHDFRAAGTVVRLPEGLRIADAVVRFTPVTGDGAQATDSIRPSEGMPLDILGRGPGLLEIRFPGRRPYAEYRADWSGKVAPTDADLAPAGDADILPVVVNNHAKPNYHEMVNEPIRDAQVAVLRAVHRGLDGRGVRVALVGAGEGDWPGWEVKPFLACPAAIPGRDTRAARHGLPAAELWGRVREAVLAAGAGGAGPAQVRVLVVTPSVARLDATAMPDDLRDRVLNREVRVALVVVAPTVFNEAKLRRTLTHDRTPLAEVTVIPVDGLPDGVRLPERADDVGKAAAAALGARP